MNEAIKIMQSRIDELSDQIANIKKVLASAEIDHQMYLRSNTPIPPGIACKIGYDKNGLVVNGDKLSPSDIPNLPIMKITGLQGALDKLTNDIEIAKLVPSTAEVISRTRSVKGTGIKVNYDEEGRIVSSSELNIDDIPMLPITKIIGLMEQLDHLKSYNTEYKKDTEVEEIKVNPGTFTKITYDSHGRVINGSNLTLNDIPNDLISRINLIESMLPTFASSKVVENISTIINNKVDGNNPVTPGSYTKVKVDSKGLVTSGDKLSVEDIPQLPITIINDLDTILGKKAYQIDVDEINNTIAKMMSSLTKLNELNSIKERLDKAASNVDMKSVMMRMDDLMELFTELQAKIPNELILSQLQQIENELSSISGRVSVLENKIRQ